MFQNLFSKLFAVCKLRDKYKKPTQVSNSHIGLDKETVSIRVFCFYRDVLTH
jgi:hypothetical protein